MADLMKGKSTTILCILTASDVPFSGTVTNPSIMFSVDGGAASDVLLTSTNVYNSDLEGWLFTPPIQYAGNSYSCTIKGDNIDNYYLNGLIKSGGGMGTLQPYISFDASAKTITTSNTALGIKDIISIFNATAGKWIYNPGATKYGNRGPGKKFEGLTSVTSGVITFTAPNTGMEDTDELVILVH